MTPPKNLVNQLRGMGQHDLADQVIASDINIEDFEVFDEAKPLRDYCTCEQPALYHCADCPRREWVGGPLVGDF